MAYIGTPPAEFVISVTKGADRKITLNRKDADGNSVNWDGAVWISVDIDKAAPTRVDATVTADAAVLVLPSSVCDRAKSPSAQGTGGTFWRVIMATADSPPLDIAVAVGTFERHDG